MKRLAPFAVTLVLLLIGWGVTLHGDSGIGWSLIVQQSGSTKGAATTFNCSTGLTCSLSAGVVTATAAAGGVSYGTYASLPVSSSTGQMYMQTDGPYSFVANGSRGSRCRAGQQWRSRHIAGTPAGIPGAINPAELRSRQLPVERSLRW